MTTHRTLPPAAAIHHSGWARLPGTTVEVTRLPVIDTAHALPTSEPLFARLTYADALTVAAAHGARLIAPGHVEALRRHGLQLVPYLGTPIAETSLVHSERHDADVWSQLRARGWDGAQPVAGAGKHWVHGAPVGRSRLMGWDVDGPGPGLRWWQPDDVAHNRQHHDDGTTTMLERDVHRDTKPGNVLQPPASTPPASTRPRITNPGDRGVDVVAWQRWLQAAGYPLPRYGRDGDHGRGRDGQPGETETATLAYLEAEQLERDGHGGTVARGPDTEPCPPPSGIVAVPCDLELVPFLQARFCAPGMPSPLVGVCLHTAEIAESLGGAESLQRTAATWNREASWHYAVDTDSIAQSVRLTDRAFAATAASFRLVHIEIAGRAGQGVDGWADAYSQAALARVAGLLAALAHRIDFPIEQRSAEAWLTFAPGVYDHRMIGKALELARAAKLQHEPWWDSRRGRWRSTSHYDVGPTFPWADVLGAALAELARLRG